MNILKKLENSRKKTFRIPQKSRKKSHNWKNCPKPPNMKKILGASKTCLLIVGLSSDKFVPIGGYNVPRSLVRFIVVLGQLSFAAMQIIILIRNLKLGLYAILFPVHVILLFFMKVSIYVVLMIKTDRITELIDYMQDVIDKSRFRGFVCWTFLVAEWNFLI